MICGAAAEQLNSPAWHILKACSVLLPHARSTPLCSSGNHAAALALAAKLRGIPAYIVVPNNAPACKLAAVKEYGGACKSCKHKQLVHAGMYYVCVGDQLASVVSQQALHPLFMIQVSKGRPRAGVATPTQDCIVVLALRGQSSSTPPH